MPKLSRKHEDAIYAAVHHRLTDLRIQIARLPPGTPIDVKLDVMIAQAQSDAASAAGESWGSFPNREAERHREAKPPGVEKSTRNLFARVALPNGTI